MKTEIDKIDKVLQPEDLAGNLPSYMNEYFDMRDGFALFAIKLKEEFKPETLIHAPGQEKPKNLRLWELVGLHYKNQGRFYEALSIFEALYEHILLGQELSGKHGHKGMPLLWISECCLAMGFPVHAKRYLMLTLCEDAITHNGNIPANTSGIYFRLVWRDGLPDAELRRYTTEVYKLWKSNPIESMYPEWILQEIDQNWMSEFPNHQELAVYRANKMYTKNLLEKLGDKSGKNLERLAEYILSCMPGCRTTRRKRTKSTDYDIVCSMEGVEVDFRSEFGRYFVCECKDWSTPADFTTIAKFCRVLDSIKARFGIIFSSEGITGNNSTEDAEREQLKVFQDRGMVIVAVDKYDLEQVANGVNFISLLRKKYEKVRLDIFNQ